MGSESKLERGRLRGDAEIEWADTSLESQWLRRCGTKFSLFSLNLVSALFIKGEKIEVVANGAEMLRQGGIPEQKLLPCTAKLGLTVLPNAQGQNEEMAEGLPPGAPSPEFQKSADNKSGAKLW